MKNKVHIPVATPRKIIASPALMAALRRLEDKHARQSSPQNKKKPIDGQ